MEYTSCPRYMSATRISVTGICPIFAPEKEVLGAARQSGLPVVRSACPADRHTEREEIKRWLAERDREDHGFSLRLFGAMKRAHVSGW